MQMVWSGMTKYLMQCVQLRQRAVEINDIAIFGPIYDKFHNTKDPLEKGDARRGLINQQGVCPILLILNEDFIQKCEAGFDY